MEQEGGVGFEALPEGCIVYILSCTSPVDACRLSLVSPTFLLAAKSDAVWERFLPSNYQSLISQSNTLLFFSSKKDLFVHLCHNPLLIDNGKKSFWLDKRSGKKCYMLAARDLTIIWTQPTPQYWTWIYMPESRFAEVAKLVRVWWLEIRGKIDTSMLSPATCYAAYLVFKLQGAVEGFRSGDTVASVGIAGSGSNMSTIFLSPDVEPIRGPRRRRDSWLEIELGECFIEGGEDGEIEMSIMDVMPTVKAGLIVQGIEIRPKAG